MKLYEVVCCKQYICPIGNTKCTLYVIAETMDKAAVAALEKMEELEYKYDSVMQVALIADEENYQADKILAIARSKS